MKSAQATRRVIEALAGLYPGADTELHYRNAFELLVATMLSAQSTDARVNMVTPALFARYPDARALARATPAELEPQILSTGFFRQKSKALVTMAGILVNAHAGQVPADMDALTKLPGVGRKTANVVLGHALGVPGLPVDRHVLRVANRIGIAEGDDPVAVEKQLCDRLPPAMWTLASDVQILHGRRVCRPTKPLCDQCPVADECVYFAALQREARGPKAAKARAPAAGRKQKGMRRR
jgi:endonuclease-3